MYRCPHCDKECKNANSLRNHERLCKSNPNRQTVDMSMAVAASVKLAIETAAVRRAELLNQYLKNPKICIECGQIHEFYKRNNKFCSASCGATNANKRKPPRTIESRDKTSKSVSDAHSKMIKNHEKKNKNCLTCNVTIPHNRKYCSNQKCRFEHGQGRQSCCFL